MWQFREPHAGQLLLGCPAWALVRCGCLPCRRGSICGDLVFSCPCRHRTMRHGCHGCILDSSSCVTLSRASSLFPPYIRARPDPPPTEVGPPACREEPLSPPYRSLTLYLPPSLSFVYRAEYVVQSAEYRVQSTEYRIHRPGHGVRSPESIVQGTQSRVQSPQYIVHGPEYTV